MTNLFARYAAVPQSWPDEPQNALWSSRDVMRGLDNYLDQNSLGRRVINATGGALYDNLVDPVWQAMQYGSKAVKGEPVTDADTMAAAGGAMNLVLGGGLGRAYARGTTGELGAFGGKMPKGYSARRETDSIGRTNYDIEKGGQRVGTAYVRDLGDKVQVGRVAIDDAHSRKGIGTALYGQIENDLGKPLVPDNVLSDAAYNFWLKHRPEAVADYTRQHSNWSPKSSSWNPEGVQPTQSGGNGQLAGQMEAIDALLRGDGLPPSVPTQPQGIRYLDRGSRSAGEGSHNYVVFDDQLISILRKYGLMPAAVGGAVVASPDTSSAGR